MDGDEELEDAEMAFAEHDRFATVYRYICASRDCGALNKYDG